MKGGITTLLADVTNTTKSNISTKIISIDILVPLNLINEREEKHETKKGSQKP